MNRAETGRSVGYTILETLIFLAVSAGLFASAMAFIGGRQGRTEFSTAVRSFESAMNDIANDVSDGYYTNDATNSSGQTGLRITCSATAAAITISTGADNQGGNKGCLFIGKAIQFMSSSVTKEKYVTYTLVGRQYKNGDITYGDVTSYTESGVKAIAPDGSGTIDATTVVRIGGGATAECVFYAANSITPGTPPCTSTAGVVQIDTIAFMTKFHGTDIQGNQETGSANVNLVVPSSSPPSLSRSTAMVAVSLNAYRENNTTVNPAVYICLQSNGSDQHALVNIGGINSRFAASTTIEGGSCR